MEVQRAHTYCVRYAWFLYSRLATVLTERGYCVDLPQRRCSFSTSNSAANALTAAGSSAPLQQQFHVPSSARRLSGARVVYSVTMDSHDRYSAQMTPSSVTARIDAESKARTNALM
jgi:hypothetical protein